MKKKKLLCALGVLFLFIAAFFVYDIAVSYGEFDRNRDNINAIAAKQRDISRDSRRIQLKIDRFSKDSRAAEEIIRLKYGMMRSDQYKYIPEK